MQHTENLGLLKPDKDDFFSVEHANSNADIIDAAIKANEDAIKENEEALLDRYTKAETKSLFSNENLLDNPFFTINERGQSVYQITNSYALSRWYASGGKITVLDKGINITPKYYPDTHLFHQVKRKNLKAGTILTISTIIDIKKFPANGHITIYCNFYKDENQVQAVYRDLYATNSGFNSFTLTLSSDCNKYQFGFIAYGALEEGELSFDNIANKIERGTISTLLNDIPPDYDTELLKCQTSNVDTSDTYANKIVMPASCGNTDLTSGVSFLSDNSVYYMYS